MKQDMEQLVKCLNTQKYLYGELLKLGEEKKQVIIDNNIDALNDIVEQEKTLITKLSAIETFRQKCAEKINKDLGLEQDSSLSQVIEKAEGTKDVLSGLLQELSGVITKLKRVNNLNSGLINMQLDYIDVVKSTFFNNSINNYGNDGKTSKEQQSINLFDRMV